MTTQSFQQLTFVAAGQSGLVTGAQASRAGVDGSELGRLAGAGLMFELDWDVHQLTSSPLAPRFAYPYAAWLALAPDKFVSERPTTRHEGAVLSHGSAARLHGLGAVSAPTTTFIAPSTARTTGATAIPRAVEVHEATLDATEVTVLGGVAVTTPHRTILDLVRAHTDHGEVRGAITDAVRRDLVDLATLYNDLVPLADHHEFPADGQEFAGYFLPELPAASLSPRNLRALATVVLPDRVAEVERSLVRALVAAPGGTRADEQTVRALAADIVGRTERV
jgi:hypothetical protein